MRKFVRFVAFITCVFLISSLFACSNSNTNKSSSSQTGQIVLLVDMHGWMPTVNTVPTADNPSVFLSTQKIADEFTKLNPNIKIKWARSKPVGGLDKEIAQWFTTQINAGSAPAIAFTWGTKYQDRDWYIPLDEYLSKPNPYISGNQKWSDIFPGYLLARPSIEDVNGKVVAIPIALFAGPPTGYYYNKDAFAKASISSVPKTWEEFINDTQKLKDAGYMPLAPWGFFKSIQFNQWVEQFIIGQGVAGYIKDQCDYNKDGTVDSAEMVRAAKQGLYNPVKNDYAKEVYNQLKRYYTTVLSPGWQNADFMTPWNKGTLGMKEEGIWAIQAENNNKAKKYQWGVFPVPVLSTDTTKYAGKVEYTEKGPYQPDADLQLNILKPTVKDNPAMLDAAVKFLQFLTTPENESMMLLEQGSDIGAVKGCAIPPLLKDYMDNPFPKSSGASWPAAFTDECSLDLDKNFELWVDGQMSDSAFFQKVDELQQKGANSFIKSMNIDTKGWIIAEQ